MNPWFICRPAFISNEQEGVNYIVVELDLPLLKEMRRAREALREVERILFKDSASIHIYSYAPYWLESLPSELDGRTIEDVDEFDDWTRIQEPPLLEQLAASQDEDPGRTENEALDKALENSQVRTENDRLIITERDRLYFECTLKHSDVTVESPVLTQEMLDLLDADTLNENSNNETEARDADL